jgi:quercetin dioxygenase-like cupin family protein
MSEESTQTPGLYVRHESDANSERSLCGWRYRLISEGDEDVQAWAHAVDIDGSKAHYHKIGTELYYVVEGEGVLILDGVEHPVTKGSFAHIPPGVVHRPHEGSRRGYPQHRRLGFVFSGGVAESLE